MKSGSVHSQRSTCRPPVIALHCSGAGASQWHSLAEALGGDYEVLAPEHYGAATSGAWTGEHSFTLADDAAAAIALVDASQDKVPIDTGTAAPMAQALLVNLVLMSIFAIQHSVMARPRFKQWWTKFVPPAVERSTYVLLASLALAFLLWQWRPMPAIFWHVANPSLAMAVTILSFVGWAVALASTFLINHFELFGLQQVANNFVGQPTPALRFRTPLFYKFVRHPLYSVSSLHSGRHRP